MKFWRKPLFTPGVRLGWTKLTDQDRVRHCHIVGASGSGKTEAFKKLIFSDIARGMGCFIIDAKGDRELFEQVRTMCALNGRQNDLYLLSSSYVDESIVWNPCGLGNAAELQSKFYNSNIFSEPFYAKACEHGLLKAFNHLSKQSPNFGLNELVQELKHQAKQEKNENLEGLFYDFFNLANSEWGSVLGVDPKFQTKEVSLLDIVQNRKILFVDLPTEGRSIQSSRVGRLLTQELILISGLKKIHPELNKAGLFSVYIDEFDAFATESFATFLNKGRSSNFMIHIAHQTLSDIRRISPEFAGQILGNCNVHLVFRQDDPDDSDYWSRFFGTRKQIKSTYQAQDGMRTGGSSNRETMEFIISPDTIRKLPVGHCVLSVKNSKILKQIKLRPAKVPSSFESNSLPIKKPKVSVRKLGDSHSQSDFSPEKFGIEHKTEKKNTTDQKGDLWNLFGK